MKSGLYIRPSYTNRLRLLCLYRHVAAMLHSLHHRELGFGLGDKGDKLIVGHVDGTLELPSDPEC